MSPTAQALLQQALNLDEQDRASVAGVLIESLHGEADPDERLMRAYAGQGDAMLEEVEELLGGQAWPSE